MAALPPPSFDPRALLPMPGQKVVRAGAQASAARLIGHARALPSDAPTTGVSMLALRSGGAKKRRR